MFNRLFILVLFYLVPSFSTPVTTCPRRDEFLSHPTHAQPGIMTSLTQMLGFDYIRNFLQKNFEDNDAVCSQMIALEKDDYQYYRYLVRLDVHSQTKNQHYQFFFFFQDSSTQAFHNHGGKPWIGLDAETIIRFTKKIDIALLSRLNPILSPVHVETFNYDENRSVASIIENSNTFSKLGSLVVKSTLSTLSFSESKGLATVMKRTSSSANVFTNQESVDGIFYQIDHQNRVIHLMPFSPRHQTIDFESKAISLYDLLDQNRRETFVNPKLKSWSEYVFELGSLSH